MSALLFAAILAVHSPRPAVSGVGFTGAGPGITSFVGTRVEPEEVTEFFIAGQDRGELRAILVIRSNGDILLREKKIGHDAKLGEIIGKQTWNAPRSSK